jgi:(p)ppGpp synthase/HD superfamily hydrolase
VPLTDRFDEALTYASDVHRTQTRKGDGVPYVAHVLAAASLVLEFGGDEDQAIAALLHDAAEDAGGADRVRDIRARFGARVADIVEVCSDTLEDPKPPWRDRKETFLERLETAPADALLVIAADKLHNAGSILRDLRRVGETVWDRFSAGRDSQLWYYRRLTSILILRLPGPLTDEFAATVEQLTAEA